MTILTKSVPRFDSRDVNGFLQEVYNYLSSIMEQIDFALTKYRGQLGNLNLPATYKQVETVEGEITALSSVVNGISARVDILDEHQDEADQVIDQMRLDLNGLMVRMEEAKKSLTSVEKQVSEMDSRIVLLNSTVEMLGERVSRLEQQEEM